MYQLDFFSDEAAGVLRAAASGIAAAVTRPNMCVRHPNAAVRRPNTCMRHCHIDVRRCRTCIFNCRTRESRGWVCGSAAHAYSGAARAYSNAVRPYSIAVLAYSGGGFGETRLTD